MISNINASSNMIVKNVKDTWNLNAWKIDHSNFVSNR